MLIPLRSYTVCGSSFPRLLWKQSLSIDADILFKKIKERKNSADTPPNFIDLWLLIISVMW